MLNKLLLVVKVGTNVLTTSGGFLDQEIQGNLVQQIITLRKQGYQVILVSSGAVGAGRSMFSPKTTHKVENRQILASIGQPILISSYRDFFQKYGVKVGQVLATKEDFRDRHHYLNMRNCLRALLSEEVVPIINENDAIAIDELMFTDNDELAGLVASMMNASRLMILTDVDGVMDRDPADPSAQILLEIDPKNIKKMPVFKGQISSAGRGGMATKFQVGCRLAGMGVTVHIANGKRDNILQSILEEGSGTKFKSHQKLSPVKKWIAYQHDNGRPVIIINEGAASALTNYAANSLLPVGVVAIEGSFRKGDIAIIKDIKGHQIGIGLTRYNSDSAQKFIGKKGQKALIHYNYLFISSQKNEK